MTHSKRHVPESALRRRSARNRLYAGLFTVLFAVSLAAVIPACSDNLPSPPEETITNVVTAVYQSPEDFAQNPIELNGEALDQEWGGPLQPGRGYTQIRLSSDVGNGNPGPPRYVSMKAVYTQTDLFLLFRWPDLEPNDHAGFLYYIGPSFPLFEVLCGPEYSDTTVVRDTSDVPMPDFDEVIDCPDGGGPCDTFYVRTTLIIDQCDTVRVTGCRDELVDPDNWVQLGNEDRMAIAFQVGDRAGDAGGAYSDQGCLVACHANEDPAFGRPGYGKLDIWQWLASRTNTVRDLYRDNDNPNFPVFGTPGYLEDMVSDPGSGLLPDPGLAPYVRNTHPGTAVPRYVYRCMDDPFCEPEEPSSCANLFGERCRINNGVPLDYLWRETRNFERFLQFSSCDTINDSPLPVGTEPRPWRFGDSAPGYILTYPTGSRADVHGSGVWDEGIWTLEVARPLRTNDPNNDIQLRPEEGLEVVFTLAVMDDSGVVHWGSEPQIIRFGVQE